MEKENMPPDGNDNNNVTSSCRVTNEKIQYVGSVSEKGDKIVYGNDNVNEEKEKDDDADADADDDDDDDDDDDEEEPLFEDSFSTPPPEEELPQEHQESSHQSLVVSPTKDSNSSIKNESSTSPLSLSSLELVFPSFVVAGLQRKASSILMLKSWIKLSLSLDGRDKITKCTYK
jgi:hypothetical protein